MLIKNRGRGERTPVRQEERISVRSRMRYHVCADRERCRRVILDNDRTSPHRAETVRHMPRYDVCKRACSCGDDPDVTRWIVLGMRGLRRGQHKSCDREKTEKTRYSVHGMSPCLV